MVRNAAFMAGLVTGAIIAAFVIRSLVPSWPNPPREVAGRNPDSHGTAYGRNGFCGACHEDTAAALAATPHGENVKDNCTICHVFREGERLPPDRFAGDGRFFQPTTPAVCARCHLRSLNDWNRGKHPGPLRNAVNTLRGRNAKRLRTFHGFTAKTANPCVVCHVLH